MKRSGSWGLWTAGAVAGSINGLFGGGGGMVLVPMLTVFTDISDDDVFPASVCTIFPICIVSLCIGARDSALPWLEALPYLLGSIPGGILATKTAHKLPVKWLHRILGILILWGGIRYLC